MASLLQGGDKTKFFDPTAFERAASAARELNSSKHTKEALEITRSKELTRQKELDLDRAKYLAHQEELALARTQEEEAAAKRTIQLQTERDKKLADYNDELERVRIKEMNLFQKRMQEEERQKNEMSVQRQEEIRRKTLEYEAELRQQTDLAKVKAETEGRISQERRNHDLAKEKIRLSSEESRITVLEGIKLSLSTVGAGLNEFVNNKERLLNVGEFVVGTVIAISAGRTAIGVAGRIIESRLGKPSLVRDTSRINFSQLTRHPLQSFKHAFGKNNGEQALKNIVLENTLSERLRRVALSTASTKANRAPFRHLLLYGPPGTGKTMFAKGLALRSGMHYAIMTGGDIAPLGKDAVTEIHKLFDWAESTNKGVVVFVDEADAFLRKRSSERISEDMRNALNAFLYRTGEASKKFMVVYASNQPEQFDWAINDRIDEMVEFVLPGYDERLRMLHQYVDQMLKSPQDGAKQISLINFSDDFIENIAKQTSGYSGREISKLVIAWQAAAYGNQNAVLDDQIMLRVLKESQDSKSQKRSWLSKEEILHLTCDSSE